MKKVIFGLISIISLTTSLAGGYNRNRNSCNWSVNCNWQYKADARVQCFGIPTRTFQKACPLDHIPQSNNCLMNTGHAYAYASNNNAWQKADNNNGAWLYDGHVHNRKRFCSRGENYSDLLMLTSFLADDKAEDAYERSFITTESSSFSNDRLSVSGIKGYLKTRGNGMYSSFEIMAWLPTNESDTIESIEKAFFYGKVELRSNRLIVSGDFKESDFIFERLENGEVQVTLNNFSIEAIYPNGVTNNNIIEVVGISDGGVDEEYFLKENTDASKISVSPNPSSNMMTIEILSIFEGSEVLEIRFFDFQGNLLPCQPISIPNVINERLTISLNELGLPLGNLRLLVLSTKEASMVNIIHN